MNELGEMLARHYRAFLNYINYKYLRWKNEEPKTNSIKRNF